MDLSFRSAVSDKQFKGFLNGMEEEVCECNKLYFVYVAMFLGPMRLHRIFPFHIHCIVVDKFSFH